MKAKAFHDLPNRLREIRLSKGLSMLDLSERAKERGGRLSHQMVQKLETGERQLTQRWMNVVAEVLQIKPAELLPKDQDDRSAESPRPHPTGIRSLPLYGIVADSGDGWFTHGAHPDRMIDPDILAGEENYALYMAGEHMVPRLQPRDLLYITPHLPPRGGDCVVIGNHDQRVIILELVRKGPDKVICHQLQPERERVIPMTEVSYIHTVGFVGLAM
jgi:transcriptional regulator with XRE-family HTH domain